LTASDVIEVLSALDPHGVNVWIDSGWGVDALLGEQARDRTEQVLGDLGFHHDRSVEHDIRVLARRFEVGPLPPPFWTG
jgi:hypothetical protein